MTNIPELEWMVSDGASDFALGTHEQRVQQAVLRGMSKAGLFDGMDIVERLRKSKIIADIVRAYLQGDKQ